MWRMVPKSFKRFMLKAENENFSGIWERKFTAIYIFCDCFFVVEIRKQKFGKQFFKFCSTQRRKWKRNGSANKR